MVIICLTKSQLDLNGAKFAHMYPTHKDAFDAKNMVTLIITVQVRKDVQTVHLPISSTLERLMSTNT